MVPCIYKFWKVREYHIVTLKQLFEPSDMTVGKQHFCYRSGKWKNRGIKKRTVRKT